LIYLDSSVVLADLFTERRNVSDSFWREDLVSSRLLEYEVWNRIHARDLARAKGERAKFLINQIDLIDMTPAVLARALKPFSISLRTLDSLHVASLEYLHAKDRLMVLASYDKRMVAAAESLDIQLYEF
jgi:hypothetical protein